jgi:hypothetical protein
MPHLYCKRIEKTLFNIYTNDNDYHYFYHSYQLNNIPQLTYFKIKKLNELKNLCIDLAPASNI